MELIEVNHDPATRRASGAAVVNWDGDGWPGPGDGAGDIAMPRADADDAEIYAYYVATLDPDSVAVGAGEDDLLVAASLVDSMFPSWYQKRQQQQPQQYETTITLRPNHPLRPGSVTFIFMDWNPAALLSKGWMLQAGSALPCQLTFHVVLPSLPPPARGPERKLGASLYTRKHNPLSLPPPAPHRAQDRSLVAPYTRVAS
jgi:hypothetical protein